MSDDVGTRKAMDTNHEEEGTTEDVEKYSMVYFSEQAEKEMFIPTGATMLNLACSNNPFGGFSPGRFTNIIGFTHTGKTILALTALAEIANNPIFDDYDLYYDDVEQASGFDIEYMFGNELFQRLIQDEPSNTIQDYFIKVLKLIKKGTPFIDVTDSLDALTSEEEIKRAKKKLAKATKSSDDSTDKKKEKGSYKTEKPKELSEMLRIIKANMAEMGSHLIIVSQTRQNIGFGAQFRPLTRSGGDALHFYSYHEIWLAQRGVEKDKDLIIGSEVEAKVEKNKITGKKRRAYFNIYDDIGIDEVGSMVDFLIDFHWKKVKQTIHVPELDLEGTRAKVIAYIEQENAERDIQALCGKVWNEREDSVKLDYRKRRFG